MKKKKSKFTKAKKYSFDSPKDLKEIEKYTYQDYLRNQNKKMEKVDYKRLEEIFTNEIYYKAMKKLPLREKHAIYLVIFDSNDLEKACSEMKLSKTEIIEIKTKGINRFKENVSKYQKAKKNGGAFNG